MKQLVIVAGGFHPFHAGHLALYQAAQAAFPAAEVYVAATNDVSERPFPFKIKEKLARVAGVEPGHFVQVASPFKSTEITQKFDPNNTELIFVRSEKDANKPPQAGGVKKDGNPSYLQPLLGATKLEPFSRHAYMAYLPTVEFGPGMTSATEIRTAWPTLNPKRKTALVMSLYPDTQKNPKLAANVVAMLDTAIGNELEESKMIDAKMIDVFYRPDTHSRARRVVAQNIPASVLDRLLEKLSDKFSVPASSFEWEKADPVSEMDAQNFVGGMTASYQDQENQPIDEDYIDEKWSQKYKSSISCANPKGFSQRAHCAGRKK
jgi:glycerol-3-phosphate cytidylyltransferase-like family protein